MTGRWEDYFRYCVMRLANWTGLVALQQLLDILNDVSEKAGKKLSKVIKSQLQQWIMALPAYVRVYLTDWICES